MAKAKVLVGAIMVASAGLVMTVGTPNRAQGFTCPCAPAAQLCITCVDSTANAVRAAINGARSSLVSLQNGFSALQTTLDEAIDLGFQAQETAMNLATQQTVAAHKAHGQSLSTQITANREVELRLYEGLKNAFETLTESRLVAEEAYRSANDFGPENTSTTSKDMAGMQTAKALPSQRAGDDVVVGEESEQGVDATADYMVSTVQSRQSTFFTEIMREDVPSDETLEQIATFMSNIDAGFGERVIRESVWDEAIATRRAMSVPPGVHRGLRDQDLVGQGDGSYHRISNRARTAAEFFAWEMALRSEIATDSGKTSLLNFVQSNVEKAYGNKESLLDTANSGERTLLNTIAAEAKLAALIDMLILEAETYGNAIEAAKIGVYNDEVFNPHYGYNQISQ